MGLHLLQRSYSRERGNASEERVRRSTGRMVSRRGKRERPTFRRMWDAAVNRRLEVDRN